MDNCFSRLNAPFSSASFQKGADIPYNALIDTGLSNAYYSVGEIVPQPRLGVVWNLQGGAKSMVIRADFGLFAEDVPLNAVEGKHMVLMQILAISRRIQLHFLDPFILV